MSARLPAATLTVLALAAYHRSGTWSDDLKNFERAWGEPAPRGLEIRHDRRVLHQRLPAVAKFFARRRAFTLRYHENGMRVPSGRGYHEPIFVLE